MNEIIEEDWYEGEGGLDLLNINLNYYGCEIVLSDECSRWYVKKNNVSEEVWDKFMKWYKGEDLSEDWEYELEELCGKLI